MVSRSFHPIQHRHSLHFHLKRVTLQLNIS
uniref:Uncharacterized protein n=1 Tax=Rhizophora mucronata TaxID=61149 RepID=A0A2P2L6R5_RHIMU